MIKLRRPLCFPRRGAVAKTLFVSSLFYLSYFSGSYKTPKPLSYEIPAVHSGCLPNVAVNGNFSTVLDFRAHHTAAFLPPISSSSIPALELCPENFTHYCPCHDSARELRFHNGKALELERHCPEGDEVVRCLIPRPKGYRTPFRWPLSRDFARFPNVPFKKLVEEKRIQNWMRLEGDRLVFPGGGTSFRDGVKGYVEGISRFIPLKGGKIRSVLDVGCGVASFGAHLLDYNILTMSIAPRDIHEAQVQFALERGLPAMLGVLSVNRLPFPARSFDMAHCSRCLVPWTANNGMYLIEVDRVLRPGGYWVLSGPPIGWTKSYKGWEQKPEQLEKEQADLEDLATRLCWKKIVEKLPIAVWHKPTNHLHCIQKKKKSGAMRSPPLCQTADHDAAWYRKSKACITPLPQVTSTKEIAGGSLEKWPKRLISAPPRIFNMRAQGISPKMFVQDNLLWTRRVSHYTKFLSSLKEGKYRNVMDMNAGLGGFAAALSQHPVWVMNVVPYDLKNNTLGIIYERGLIGTYMDWCEAFSTYPRTYDLLHANGLLTMYMNKCDILDILLEMHRILRPEGAVIIRDHIDVIVKAKSVADRMQWQSRVAHSEYGAFHPEKILFVDNSADQNVSADAEQPLQHP